MFKLFHKNLKIIFIDWDDTLFPTSHHNNNNNLNNNLNIILLEKIICKFIKKCLSITKHTYIISNAKKSWIIHCISNFYPKLYSILNIHQNVISASDLYINSVNSYNLTKIHTFQHIFNNILHNSNCFYNNIMIISIGDGNHEKIALHKLQIYNHSFIKSLLIKKNLSLKQLPSDIDIIKQINFIYNNILSIIDTSNDNILCYNHI